MRLRPFYVGLSWFTVALCMVGSVVAVLGAYAAWYMIIFWALAIPFSATRLVLHYRAPKPAPSVDHSDRAALEADLFRPVSEWVAEAEAAAVRQLAQPARPALTRTIVDYADRMDETRGPYSVTFDRRLPTPSRHDVMWSSTEILSHCTACPPGECPMERSLRFPHPEDCPHDHTVYGSWLSSSLRTVCHGPDSSPRFGGRP